MAYGDCKDDVMLSGAWKEFCKALEAAGARAFKDENPANPLQRADAFRFLTQNLGQAFDLALETRDSRFPALHHFCSPSRKLGADCADFIYLQAWIDGRSTYRISGDLGTARFFNITVQGSRPKQMEDGTPPLHEPFGDVPEANLFGGDIRSASDGSFAIYVGGDEQGENWIPTSRNSRKLFIRQGFDRWDERPASLSIERIDMTEPRPIPTPTTIVEAINWSAAFISGLMDDWPAWPFAHGMGDPSRPNCFPPEINDANDRKRGRSVASMHWHIKSDEALIVEFPNHEGLWMLTNMGSFFTSMDFLYRPVSYTPSRATACEDDRIRFVLSHEDPGYHNWIDTQGFERGNLMYRHMLEGQAIRPSVSKVKAQDLAVALPSSMALATPAQRSAQMRERHAAVSRRHS